MEVALSSFVEKVGLQEVFRRPYRIDKPAIVAELPNNEFLICNQSFTVYMNQKGFMKNTSLNLYTCKYIPELDLIIGITNGVPQILFINNATECKVLNEPVRTEASYVNQIEYRDRTLIVCGSGFDIFSIDIKRVFFDPSHPNVTVKKIFSTHENIYGSLFEKIYIDFDRKRLLVPIGYGYTLFSFTGEIIKKSDSLSPVKIRTTAYFPFTGEIIASEIASAKNIFKKFVVTDHVGTIRVWDYLEKKILEYQMTNQVIMFSEFVDKKNLIIVTESFEVFMFNLKMQILTKLLDAQGQILGISIFRNPLRLCLLYLNRIEMYFIYNPLDYYCASIEAQKSIISAENDLFCSKSINGVFTFYPKNDEVPQNIISRNNAKVRDIVYDTDSRIFFIFENNQVEIYDKTKSLTEPSGTLGFEALYINISTNKSKIYILSPYNEIILLDYSNLSIIKKLRINKDNYISLNSSSTEILVFTKSSIISVNNATLTIKKNPINEIVYITSDKQYVAIFYKNNNFHIIDFEKWQIVSTFRCTKHVKSISMQNGFFVLILEDNQIIVGRPAKIAQTFSFQFEIYSAAVIGDDKLLVLSGPGFLGSINLKDHYSFLLEQQDEKPLEGKPFFQIKEPEKVVEMPQEGVSTSPQIRELPRSPRRSGRFKINEPQFAQASTPRRVIHTVSLKSMFEEMRSQSAPVLREPECTGVQLPPLHPQKFK